MGARVTIGLTGDVGTGKSSVLALLAELGATVVDADAVVHDLLACDPAVIAAVVERFGATVAAGGAIDRAALAAEVFGDAEALDALERIVHPAVLARVRAFVAETTDGVAAIEAVKLVESGMNELCDRLWLVTCDRGVRRARLAARGWSEAEIDRRMAAAAPLAPRLALADAVIDNSGTPDATRRQVEMAWQHIS